DVDGDASIAKISIIGLGMKDHAGVASRMFQVLADEGVNIQLISTSEIKISVVIDEAHTERAVRALHAAFVEAGAGEPAPEKEAGWAPTRARARRSRSPRCCSRCRWRGPRRGRRAAWPPARSRPPRATPRRCAATAARP